MLARAPNVFLSSTYYDLRQVRADLRTFVSDALGYNLLSSEVSNFPVEPNADAIENCRTRVERDADIFVLIIGSRYGSVHSDSTLSITNVEYRVARVKHIPIFAFVQRDTIALLEVWKRNPAGNFDGLVDNTHIFEFIESVRDKDKVWTFPFDVAADIISALRSQFAYMMTAGIEVSRQLAGAALETASLSNEAFRLLVDRPGGWPALLFASLLRDQIDALSSKRMNHGRGIALGASEILTHESMPAWLQACISEARRIVEAVRVAPHRINDAIASADLGKMQSSAAELVNAYRHALEWAVKLRRAYVPPLWQNLITEKALWLDDILKEIEQLPNSIVTQIQTAATTHSSGVHVVEIKLPLRLSNTERIQSEIDRLSLNLDRK